MNEVEARLALIRGAVPPREHTARTIAALSGNPGCARRAVLDAAGVDKQRLAAFAGFPAPTGQSRFAITRGNVFEALVKADGCAELLRLLREHLHLSIPEVAYADLEVVGGNTSVEIRHAGSRHVLAQAAASGEGAGTLFDHPLLRLDVGGRPAYLEPDLIAFKLHDRFHVVEIKSFAIIDGQADGGRVAEAVTQAAVYVLALRELLAEFGYGPELVSHDVVLVCPENFANRPTAVLVDVRKQITVLKRQLSRLARVAVLIAALPPELTFDLAPDAAGVPRRPSGELVEALRSIEARYAPECLEICELAYFCRGEAVARGDTAALGRTVRDELGGIESVATALGLAEGTLRPAADQAEAARALMLATRLREETMVAMLRNLPLGSTPDLPLGGVRDLPLGGAA